MEEDDCKYIMRGPPFHIPVSRISVGKQIYDSLMENSDKDLFINVTTNTKATYSDYHSSTAKLATSLRNHGFSRNDIVAVCSENSEKFFEPVVACLYLGIIISPISHLYTESEISYALHLTKPKAVFCSKAVAAKFISLRKNCVFLQEIIVMDSFEELPGTVNLESYKSANGSGYWNELNFRPIDVNVEEQIAMILYSSGTTGLPKGVMTTHANINIRLTHIRDPAIHLCWGKSKMINLPFFHSYGFILALESMVLGREIITMSKFNEELYYSSIEKYKINQMGLVPSILAIIAKSDLVLKYDLSHVRDVVSGSAPLSNVIEEAVTKRLKIKCIRQGYGTTETTSAMLLVPIGEYKPGSSGKVVPGMSVKIRDPKTGKTLGPGKPGELCVKGGSVMKGYFKNPEATQQTITDDGWLLTGDLAYFNEEGYFYVVDRLKELIKYKGFQVAPAELEALLQKHPKIIDAGVVGKPDHMAGELPLAFVVKKDGVLLSEEDVKMYIEENVSYSKYLRGGVKFIEEIPRNGSGKILRRKLKQLIQNGKSKL